MTTCSAHLRRAAAFILILNSFTALSHSVDHNIIYFVGCFYNGTAEVLYEYDRQELLYADFEKQAIVYTIPAFIVLDPSTMVDGQHIYNNANKGKRACSAVMTYAKAQMKDPPEERDPPVSFLYTAAEVQLGVENRLICYVNHFYPPFVKVTWTKNNQPVSEGVSVGRYVANDDSTFNLLATLTFTPREGDMYSCTVEHVALERPRTEVWEAEGGASGLGLSIYCGVGLLVGLFGVAAGTFLIVKACEVN